MDKNEIEGVLLTNLKVIPKQSGDIFHALKQSEESFFKFGEAYFSCVNYCEIKGWKKHKEMILNIIVPIGKIRFALYDDRDFSKTKGKYSDITLSLENYKRLTIPHCIWFAFKGIKKSNNILLNISSIEHDPSESETKDLNEIKFNW